jgi:hypothetical protein
MACLIQNLDHIQPEQTTEHNNMDPKATINQTPFMGISVYPKLFPCKMPEKILCPQHQPEANPSASFHSKPAWLESQLGG